MYEHFVNTANIQQVYKHESQKEKRKKYIILQSKWELSFGYRVKRNKKKKGQTNERKERTERNVKIIRDFHETRENFIRAYLLLSIHSLLLSLKKD